MGRPRLTIGRFGEITTRVLPSGRFEARTRYRDWDGRTRIVQATADTAKAAERALKQKLAGRSGVQPAASSDHLTPDSPFGDLVAYWLQDLDLEGRISKTTRLLYERNMRTLVLPVFEHLTLREIGVARCDRFIKEQARISYNRAKQSALSGLTRSGTLRLDGTWSPAVRAIAELDRSFRDPSGRNPWRQGR